MMLTHKDEAVRFANSMTLKLKHKRDLKEFDKKIIEQLDQKVSLEFLLSIVFLKLFI